MNFEGLHEFISNYIYGGYNKNEVSDELTYIKSINNSSYYLIKNLMSIASELNSNGIESIDYLNYNNIGIKNNNLVYYDIGYDGNEAKEPTNLEKEYLNESLKDDSNEFLKKKFKSFKYLGGGENGHAYRLTDELVIKFTNDFTEVNNSQKLIGKNNKHLVKVYSVKEYYLGKKKLYGIIQSYLLKPKNIGNMYYDLDNILTNFYNLNNNFTLDELKDINDEKIRDFFLYYYKFGKPYLNKVNKNDFNNINDLISIVDFTIGSKTFNNHKKIDERLYDVYNKIKEGY